MPGILSAVVYLLRKKTLRSRQPVNVGAKIGTRSILTPDPEFLKLCSKVSLLSH